MHGLDGLHDIQAVLARGLEFKLGLEPVQELLPWLLPDAHRAVALDVAVPTDGAGARPGASDVAPKKKEIDDLLDRADGILVLREAHGPACDDALGAHGDSRRGADLLLAQPAALRDLLP